jgi:ubiquinone/menaquinone biosynthesis C-methylase UbiE
MPSRVAANAEGTPSSPVSQASGSAGFSIGESVDGWGTARTLSGNFKRTMSAKKTPPERSFGPVAEAYDRARPSYPDEAVTWLTGNTHSMVLELGAGTGKLTEVLHRAGHEVLATDPLPEMLKVLGSRVDVHRVVATAEHIPLRSRSVDVVVCGQSFHWFDHSVAMAEIARVLRPEGILALAWNTYDVGIPWVKRLKRLISPDVGDEQAMPLMETPYFGFVDQKQFRFWQPHTAKTLADLARSVSHVATMSEADRATTLAKVDELYAEYGRGHDGMQVPYITKCYRAVVRHQQLPPEVPDAPPPGLEADGEPTGPVTRPDRKPPEDPGMQLIDFK